MLFFFSTNIFSQYTILLPIGCLIFIYLCTALNGHTLHHRKIIRINYLEAAWCGCWSLSTHIRFDRARKKTCSKTSPNMPYIIWCTSLYYHFFSFHFYNNSKYFCCWLDFVHKFIHHGWYTHKKERTDRTSNKHLYKHNENENTNIEQHEAQSIQSISHGALVLVYYFCTVRLDSTLHCSILLCVLLYFALRME